MSILDFIKTNTSMQETFRLRGKDITRLETFMDAAFAFALTMLVISVGEIPKNYPELILSLKAIPAFLLSFLVIMDFWLSHRNWSRRYGLEDKYTIFLSIALIFVLLIFLYPLRLMFSALFTWISNGWVPSVFHIKTLDELNGLFIIFGFGLFAMAGIMALLYWRALTMRKQLKLNNFEIIVSKKSFLSLFSASIIGLTVAILSWILPKEIALLPGFLYIIPFIARVLISQFYK